MNLYYKIWVDALYRSIRINGEKHGKAMLLVGYPAFQLINYMTILTLIFIMIDSFSIAFEPTLLLDINIFSIDFFNNIVSITISTYLPLFLINYFLIFFKKRYEKLMKKYKDHNGKLVVKYIIVSLLLLTVLSVLLIEFIPK